MNISFEYTGTLSTLEVERLYWLAKESGATVFIVTKLKKIAPRSNRTQNVGLFFLAKRLGIPKARIIFTGGDIKVGHLLRLQIDCHVDNCGVELFFIKKNKDRRIRVFHTSEKMLKAKFLKFLNRE